MVQARTLFSFYLDFGHEKKQLQYDLDSDFSLNVQIWYLFKNPVDISQQAYYRLFWDTDLFLKI